MTASLLKEKLASGIPCTLLFAYLFCGARDQIQSLCLLTRPLPLFPPIVIFFLVLNLKKKKTSMKLE